MADTPNGARSKELARSAVAEALGKHQNWVTKPPPKPRTVRTVVLWLLLLAIAIGLYYVVEFWVTG